MSGKKRDNLSISPWISRFCHLIREGGTVLDLAAGGGRHTRFLLERGFSVTALDRDISKLQAMKAGRSTKAAHLDIIAADLEDGSPWPLLKRRFDAVIVVNYLWRPLFPSLLDALTPDGVLLYDTFAVGQEKIGKPSNPDFLLRPGELLEVVRGRLDVIAYEHGEIAGAIGPAIKQRIAAGGAGPVSLTAT
jgi:SAM-dependent methyltransferase